MLNNPSLSQLLYLFQTVKRPNISIEDRNSVPGATPGITSGGLNGAKRRTPAHTTKHIISITAPRLKAAVDMNKTFSL
jgi:hypothetical protein